MYSKRIDEKTSSNRMGKNGNIWLHPDIVGLEDLSSDWDSLVKDCVKLYADQQSKLWSFEVKILLNMSNVRESFFKLYLILHGLILVIWSLHKLRVVIH
ncbi:hypothetical protein GASC598P17_003320 [Gilliamella apis SCGC AB-598-P17]|nr:MULTISPECIES: hypothetical protein [Gilliamella]KES15177.1 hypothetical protein GASC598P17_003320 [Gilliamella apis SCGC AB-598-P17]